jgi:hypothetical protein
VSEKWENLMGKKRSLMEEVQNFKELSFRKRRLYYKLNKEANWLERCYLDSIIHKGLAYIGGADTDVSGDRVRVFIGKTYENYQYKDLEGARYVIKKYFLSLSEYKRKKCWLKRNYEKYASLYKKNFEKFITFKEFHFLKKT